MVLNYICTLVSVLVLIVVHVCDAGQTCSSCSGIELAEGCGHHIKCNDTEVFQRRFNGSVDFYRNWEAYKTGFGTVDGEFWLGNEIIHTLTAQGNHELKIVLTDFSNAAKYALYSSFRIADESQWYQLSVSGYSGTAGDALSVHNGMKLSTFDRDNDASRLHHCAQSYKGAWWYKECHDSNLNGHYYTGQHHSYADGIEWHQWHGYHYSLRTTTMMIKRK